MDRVVILWVRRVSCSVCGTVIGKDKEGKGRLHTWEGGGSGGDTIIGEGKRVVSTTEDMEDEGTI